MSILRGVISSNCSIISSELCVMYDSMKHMPHEKDSVQVRDNVGMGQMLTYNTPESVYDVSPVYLSEPKIMMVTEGRLDNRQDLGQKLGIKLEDTLTDGKLMEKAFLKWGKNCPQYLRGDWSFAVYDFKEKELLLARDHHGYTAIYYHLNKNGFYFSSSIKGILALEGFERKVNMKYFLSGLIILPPKEKNLQAYEDVFIVPPAHTLTFKDGKSELKRYWFPENTPLRQYKNNDLYAEELKEILTETIRQQLRSHGPVTSHLSGGLDSGTVSVIAAQLLKEQGKRLTTLSHVPHFKKELSQISSKNSILDESLNILATANFSKNIDPFLFDGISVSPLEGIQWATNAVNIPFHGAANISFIKSINAQAYEMGYRTVLTGEMGNGSISYTGMSHLAPVYDSLFWTTPRSNLKSLSRLCLSLSFPGIMNKLWEKRIVKYMEVQYLNKGMLNYWNELNGYSRLDSSFLTPATTAAKNMLQILDVGYNFRCLFGHIINNEFGLEQRDPTANVDVIEYCLSIPNDAFVTKQYDSKAILKGMMKNNLPDQVLLSKKKGIQSADVSFRLLKDQVKIDEFLHEFRVNSTVKSMFDVNSIIKDWESIKNNEALSSGRHINLFLKSFSFMYFLINK